MKREKVSTRIVLLTAALNQVDVLQAIRLGVQGIVLKEMAPGLLVQCVRKVHAGDQWLEKHFIRKAMDTLLHRTDQARQRTQVLTPREVEIVRMVARGLRNNEIARNVSITEGTVKMHVHNIYEKLHVDSRVALACWVREQNLIA